MHSAYRVRPVSRPQEWDDCFNAIDKPHITQAGHYGDAKQKTVGWRVQQLVFERGSTPVAICQFLEKRVAGLRVAARINRGPLFLDAAPSYETRENVYRLLRKPWKYLTGGALLIAPGLEATEENQHLLRQLGYKDRKIKGWSSALMDLLPDEAEIRRKLTSAWRNRLQASLKSGLQLQVSTSTESVAWIIERHLDNMREKQFPGPTQAFLQALYLNKPGDFIVMKAVYEGKPVAGAIICRFGQAAEYLVGWFGAEGRQYNCGNFLYWHAMLHMKAAGCRWFDLGGYSISDKFGHFKQNMRGAEYRLIGEWLAY